MSLKPRLAWISKSAIGVSETFIGDTLDHLHDLAEVIAFCGRPTSSKPRTDVTYLEFDAVPLRLHHTVRKKLTGRNTWIRKKSNRAKRTLKPLLDAFQPDLIWVEFGTTLPLIEWLLQQGQPFVVNVHGYDISREFNDSNYQKQFTRLCNQAAAILCASYHTRHLCIAAGIDSQLCKVIRYSLDGEAIKPSSNSQLTKNPSFVHFGRLTPKKGSLITLEAFRQARQHIPRAELTFIGDGPEHEELQRRSARFGLTDCVHFIPAMPRAQALRLVERHWIFCQHSVSAPDGDQEGFGLSPAEAALLEKPVISTFHNGLPEHIIQGTTGLLTREWDIAGMADAMVELSNNSELRLSMGKAGRANILELCSPEKRAHSIRALLDSILLEK